MENDEYLTLATPSESFYKEKGSKFLGFAFPVKTEEEVKSRLSDLKNKHHDARHHCYAYLLGPSGDHYRMNDDGEPSSTAGKPILGQIRSHKLTNVFIVVVRYFGGTLLGTSGLIRAYKTAADQAIQNGRIIKKTLQSLYELEFDYELMNEVMKLLHELDVQPYERDFQEKCRFRLGIRKNREEKAREYFRKIPRLEWKPLDKK